MKHVQRLLPTAADFSAGAFRHDLLAGITVALVALPLALGFGVTAGVGPAAGITTAIVAGFVAALLGGSNFQVSGPTGAMTVVLLPIVAIHGVSALVVVGVGAGVILVALSLLKVGRYVAFIPWPVITGFTTGIAVIIFLQQLPGLLGVEQGEGEAIIPVTIGTVSHAIDRLDGAAVVVTVITVTAMVLWQRFPRFKAVPASMVALLVGTGVSLLPALAGVQRVAGIPRGLSAPSLDGLSMMLNSDLLRAIVAVAVLAGLESLLSAVVADGMTVGERHDPDRELFGQGIANIASAAFGGMPATAALARTAVNVRSGARTRAAAMVHALVLLGIVLFLAPLAARIPLAALAGILMVVAVRMVEFDAMRAIVRSTRSDAFVLLLTLVVTVAFDLIVAIEVGMVAAGILFIGRMSRMFSVDVTPLGGDTAVGHDSNEVVEAEQALLSEHIVAYRIDGPIFFGAASRFMDQLLKVDHDVKAVVLRMRRVPVMDATGASALETMVDRLSHRGVLVLISGLQDQPRTVLERAGILDKVSRGRDHLFVTSEEAIAHARLHVQNVDHVQPARSG
ncbi:MAG TPA: SulP family inorganic anion transporter [Acidimicrobiia bacterium]|nr:SulP family inorganic anion transporter [Acidimicrobiia bacterium]